MYTIFETTRLRGIDGREYLMAIGRHDLAEDVREQLSADEFVRRPLPALTHQFSYRMRWRCLMNFLPKNRGCEMRNSAKKLRGELVTAVGTRYRESTRAEKRLILDEFVALTGYHRKHATRLLKERGALSAITPRTRKGTIYDEAVRQALILLWEASDRICGKRLKPVLPLLVTSLERHGHLALDSIVRAKLLKVSPATIDRLLAPVRREGRERPRRNQALKHSVSIKTFADWKESTPGYAEVDLVSHCGGSITGSYVHTLTLTDVATGWTECVALLARDSSLVVEALRRLMEAMPMPLLGINTDNGSEFMNEVLIA